MSPTTHLTTAMLALGLAGCAGRACETSEPASAPSGAAGAPAATPALADGGAGGDATPSAAPEAEATDAPDAAPTCEARLAELEARVDGLLEAGGGCLFNVDCAVVAVSTSCYEPCPVAVAARAVAALRAAPEAIERELCPPFASAGCAPLRAECARSTPRCAEGRCALGTGDPVVTAAEVPDENRASRTDPPPRPPPGDADERARRLFEAVVHDDPARARDFFFPLEAFREVKGIADPDGYWERLFARFEQDIHALHASLPDLDRAEFERLEIVRRGGWVVPGEEANRLPYWAARHNRLHYRVDGRSRSFEVRVLITWGTRWYVTHLSEFH